tara:strand:+ start:125 stop:292 length:168 start_codon:yes stop_codon:yes gene_type:complete
MIDEKDSFHPALLEVLNKIELRLNRQREAIDILGHALLHMNDDLMFKQDIGDEEE